MLKGWQRRKQARARDQFSRGFGAAFSAVLLRGHDIDQLQASPSGSGIAFDLGVMEGIRHINRVTYLENQQIGRIDE